MTLTDLFSPLKRHFWLFALVLVITSGLSYWGLSSLPPSQKTTIYFSLVPEKTDSVTPTFDHAESTMKMAEAIAGWAKNPQFREDVAREANVVIHNFKRKLSARKQNYINVFWTLKLVGPERAYSQSVIEATINQIEQRFTALNENSQAPYRMTQPEVFSELQVIPAWAIIAFSLILGLTLGTLLVYCKEALTNKLSFTHQLQFLFPEAPTLIVPEKLGQHDEKLLERFILTFPSPRLVGTFPASEKYFSLSPTDALQEQVDTPILLIKMGSTTVQELQNLKAIFGSKVGLIVFHQ